MSAAPENVWQFYEKAPRPLLRWACILGALWAMGLCDLLSDGMESATRGVVLAFIAAVYGLRGWEKIKAQAEPEPSEPFFYGGSGGGHDIIGGYEAPHGARRPYGD